MAKVSPPLSTVKVVVPSSISHMNGSMEPTSIAKAFLKTSSAGATGPSLNALLHRGLAGFVSRRLGVDPPLASWVLSLDKKLPRRLEWGGKEEKAILGED